MPVIGASSECTSLPRMVDKLPLSIKFRINEKYDGKAESLEEFDNAVKYFCMAEDLP
ncbi:hypothetical protein RUND412_001071, partial [Rhizina undulata]